MPDLIPGAAGARELVQLCGKYTPEMHPKRSIVQWKRDGIRCAFINGALYSREGSPMHCADHALGSLQTLQERFGKPMMFDSEFVVGGSFEAANSAFKRGLPGTGLLYVFDAVPLDQWMAAGRTAPLSARLEALEAVSAPLQHLVIEHDMGNGAATHDEVQDIFADVVGQGGEGVIVKDATAPYFRGRSRTWLKLKAMQHTASGKVRHPVRAIAL